MGPSDGNIRLLLSEPGNPGCGIKILLTVKIVSFVGRPGEKCRQKKKNSMSMNG